MPVKQLLLLKKKTEGSDWNNILLDQSLLLDFRDRVRVRVAPMGRVSHLPDHYDPQAKIIYFTFYLTL